MKKFKLLSLLLVLAMFAQLLVACSSNQPSSSGGSSTNVSSASSQTPSGTPSTPLRILLSEGGSATALEGGIKNFVADTGIQVEVLKYPYAEVREKQMLDVVSQIGDIDAISIDGPIWLSEFNSFLDPIDDYVAKENYDISSVIPSMLEMFKYNGKLYSLPMRIGGWVLIYRTDLFDAKGLTPPKTMEEFRETAKALTDGSTYGFAAALKQTNYLVAQWCPFLYSYGGNFLDGDMKKAAFNDKAGIDSLQFIVDLYTKDKVIPPSAIDYEQNNIITAMQQGVAAMAVTYSPYFLDMNDPEKSNFAGKFAVSPYLPYAEGSGLTSGVTEISGWGIGINKFGRNKDATWELLKYMTSEKTQLNMAVEYANSPTVASIYQNEDYLNVYKDAPSVLSSLTNAKTRPGIAQWTEIEDILARELSAAINNVKTVEQALTDAEAEVNDTLPQ